MRWPVTQADQQRNPNAIWNRLVPLGIAGISALVALWPSAWPGEALVGHPLGETDNHLWMLWQALRRVLGDGRVLANAPVGIPIPLMDPVQLPVFLALWPLGPVLAYNGLILWSAALLMAGTALLARELSDAPGVPTVAAVAAVSAPFLAGVVDFGITESWTLGWLALHVALLLRHARTGQWIYALGAGAALGGVALSGWYHALFGLMVEAMVVPWLLWRTRRPGLLAQGLLGFLLGLPALLAFLPVRDLWDKRWHPPSAHPMPWWPDWAVLPRYGTDLLNLFLPRWETVAPSKAVYLGLATLLLAGVGLVRAPRRVGPLLAITAPFLVLALGHWPRVGGHALGFRGPAWWLSAWIPSLQGLSHWHRAVGAAVPFLAVAAAIGAERWVKRPAGLAVVCALLVADGVLFSQTAWPRPAYAPDPPAALMALGEAGVAVSGVVELPFDNGRQEFSNDPARLYNRWQPFHGHPVSENYEGPDALLERSALVAAADGAAGLSYRGPQAYRPPEIRRAAQVSTDPARVHKDREQLLGWGYRWIVLHRSRARTPDRAQDALEGALGPGEVHGDDVVWDLSR